MTYIEYIQLSWREEKEKNKKFNVYQLHNKSPLLLRFKFTACLVTQ